VGDQTYIDNNQNGFFDADDQVLGNVTVDLHEGDCPADLTTLGAPYRTLQTDANGLYLFEEVPDGPYCVVATNPGTSTALQGAEGHEVTVIGRTELFADFGFAPVGSIGDQTYVDYDLDGVFGPGDEVLGFVTVGLYEGLCPADLDTLPERLRTTITDGNGLYLFTEVPDGDYCVVSENPGGFLAQEGADGQSVTLMGDNIRTADFGYTPLVSIGDYVYTDIDQNGADDPTDRPIPGADVTLHAGLCPADPAAVLATIETDFNGLYRFDDLTPGEYCVTVSNTGLGGALEGAGGQSVTLTSQDDFDADFGFAPGGSIGDQTYIDDNQNGAYDPATDDVLPNAEITLYAGDCPADLTTLTNPLRTTTTDDNGMYLFTQVPDGDYCVVASDPNSGAPLEGAYGQEVEVQGGPELRADFGFAPIGTIGDLVYYDTNLDGTFDAGETPREGVAVTYYAGACPADLLSLGMPLGSTASDADGLYSFTQVPAGEYCVVAMDGGVDAQLEGVDGHTVTVNANDVLTADFGYVPRATIGDTVYADDNGSEVQDPSEPGLLGIPVQLFNGLCDAADPLPLQTTLTTIDGLYSFTDLPAGEYCVRATPGAVGTLTQGSGGQSVTLYGVDELDADFGVQRAGDLRVIKVISEDTVVPTPVGTEATFDLRVYNESSIVTMTDIELTDFLPDGLSFVSATDGGVHDGSAVGGNVVWAIPSISPRGRVCECDRQHQERR
jgi:uncharacterized repeat protein (TIGR01451 family)